MNFDALVQTLTDTHQTCQQQATQTINTSLVVRNWIFGYYIVEFEQQGDDRAQYGTRLIASLSDRLKAQGIKSCSVSNLKNFRQFYQAYPQISQTVSSQSRNISLLTQIGQNFSLSWSHYQILMSLQNPDERRFYEIEAATNQWSTRELDRQITTALYDRLALSRNPDEIKRLATQGQIIQHPRDIIKDPYILEFLELPQTPNYSENDLETAIINKLQQFLLELGKGFLFESRQKRFSFDEDHFYIDLVFYNRLLHCYVLIDLKLDKLTHQDLGQMQMYVNYFDRFVKTPTKTPPSASSSANAKKTHSSNSPSPKTPTSSPLNINFTSPAKKNSSNNSKKPLKTSYPAI